MKFYKCNINIWQNFSSTMDIADILYLIFDAIASGEDAKSLLNLASVNKLSWKVFTTYPNKYLRLPSLRVYKLSISNDGLASLKKDLLDLILVKTQITPMIGDIWSLVRFLRITDPSINMGNALDRLVPDNTLTRGNEMSYKPGQLLPCIMSAIVIWLSRWFGFLNTLDSFDNITEVSINIWKQLEYALDKFYRTLLRYWLESHDVSRNDWEVDYDNYALFSKQNNENPEKMTLYLNKLKTVYQLIA